MHLTHDIIVLYNTNKINQFFNSLSICIMVATFADVAKELNLSYFQAKTNDLQNTKEDDIFIGIVESLFEKYGVRFGYDFSEAGLSEFQSALVLTQKRLKKFKKNFSPKPSWYEYQNPRELWKGSKLEFTSAPFEEGDVVWQAENLGTEDPFN